LKRTWNGKRWLALLLAAEMLAATIASGGGVARAASDQALIGAATGVPYTVSGNYDVSVPHVFINQVYGGGLNTAADTYASNGFIELYNPTDSDVSLEGWSVQYADTGSSNNGGVTGPWEKVNLSGTIKKHSSYLIVGKPTGAASPTLNVAAKADLTFDRFINNKGLKVALMSNQTLLTDANPFTANPKPAGYVDMLGTAGNDNGNLIDGYETDYPTGKSSGNSKKLALRRQALQDTDNNKVDFVQVDYSATDAQTLANAPRSSVDGEWGVTPAALEIATATLPDAYAGELFSAALTVTGGKAPYTYEASGLPAGLSLHPTNGTITGILETTTASNVNVTITVTDSATPPATVTKPLTLALKGTKTPVIADTLHVDKIGQYVIGTTNEDGGVAEIVKYNKDNGYMYIVNGSTTPPTLDIVPLKQGGELTKLKSVPVDALANKDGFVFGDLTSVDVNIATKRVAVAVQNKDATANGRILLLDYEGNLLKTYEAGVQPDMVKFTSNGRYVMTADEGEFRSGTVDPKGTVTIVDTVATTDAVKHVEFDDPNVIDDLVHIRGSVDSVTGLIKGDGMKEQAITDLEPEYIALSEDETKAYVALQENNAIAIIDIAAKKVISVKGLGYKDLNDPRNALDLVKDNKINLENVPFFGMYMPDGIATHNINGKQYLFTANEGDATDFSGRKNATTIQKWKQYLNPNSAAAKFLEGKTTYDGVEIASDMGNDGIYMFGGRSFSIWNADSMEQIYDSGSDFERITAERLPKYFNASHTNTTLDSRSPKKGPEPEYVAIGEVGNRVLAFTGLERIGGVMIYDVTDPVQPKFVNYTNTRDFTKGLETDTGPEGLEFISAADSPTGRPILLVANEVGGTIAVLEMKVAKVSLDQSKLSLHTGDQAVKLNAVVTAGDSNPEQSTIVWSSSNPEIATVDQLGSVTPVAKGNAKIRATTADGLAFAEADVRVKASDAADGSWKLTVMHTNDTHAHLADAARRATLVKQVREDADETLLFDAGDVFSGDLYFTKWFGMADLKVMNEMGYDAMTFGNHEFDQGTSTLAKFVQAAKFPLVSSNIDFSKDEHMKSLLKAPALLDTKNGHTIEHAGVYPYVVLDVNGHKVGVFGLTTEDTKETSSPGKDVVFNEASASAKKTVDALQSEGINIIIALSHLGYGRDIDLAKKVQGIDLIVGGHTHTQLNAPEVVNNGGVPTVIVQANEWGKFLGRVDLTFDKQGVVQTGKDQLKGSLLTVDTTVAEDKEVKKILDPYKAELEELKKEVIGKSTVNLDGERQNVRSRETNLGNFIADGMLAWAKSKKKADFALTNGGGIRASMKEGDITMGDLRTVMPFGNTLFILDVTGQQLKDGLENGVSGAKSTDLPGKFPQVSGIRFKWDPAKPAGSKVYDIEIAKGTGYVSLNPNDTYRMATNSFVANGGDGYASFAKAIADGAYHEDLGDPDYEIFIAHVKSLGGPIKAAVEGRIVEKAKANDGGIYVPPVTKPDSEKPDTGKPETGTQPANLSGDALEVVAGKDASGQSIQQVTVKPDALTAALNQAVSTGKPEIRIDAPTITGAASFTLPADLLSTASSKNSKLTITVDTGAGSYSLPLHVLPLAGKGALDKAKVQLTIAPVADKLLQQIKASAAALGASLASEGAVSFDVAIVNGGQESAIHDFGKTYVGRVIYLSSPAGHATGVVYDPQAGAFHFVPGKGTTLNGKPAVELKRTGNSVYTALMYSKTFTDMNGHWAKQAVEQLASNLIVKGVNEQQFAPGRDMTRAEFTSLLVRGLGLSPDRSQAAVFSDIDLNAWYADTVGAAAKAGLVTGTEAGKFEPNAVITRAEMAVMTVRALEFAAQAGQANSNSGGAGSSFTDQAAIPQWAVAEVAKLANKGIMQGDEKGRFDSNAHATRAQAAAVLLRTLQELQFIAS